MRPVLLTAVLLATYSLTQNQNQDQAALVCKGEYSEIKPGANGTTRTSLQDRWQMYKMPDGNYAVEVQRLPLSESHRLDERHIFSNTMESLSADIGLHGGAKIHCDYLPNDIACTMSGPDGTSISSRLVQSKPYVFVPAALPLADLAWLGQALGIQANRAPGSVTAIPMITMLHDENGKDEVKLIADEPVTVESLGSETLDLLNQRVSALKFRMKDSAESHSGEPAYFWMSKSGLLLQVTSGQIVVTRLSSYEGPPLG
jgi:hypothetical protein